MSRSRRQFLRASLAAGLGGAGASGWMPLLAQQAARDTAANGGRRRHKACILCWMVGGPTHHESFDPKTEGGADYNSQCGVIDTAVPGVKVCEPFPGLAGQMKHVALLRGMSTRFSDHGLGRQAVLTGRVGATGGLQHPVVGAVVGKELRPDDASLPGFVVCGSRSGAGVLAVSGFLGPRHEGTVINDVERGLENRAVHAATADFDRRVEVLAGLEREFGKRGEADPGFAHRTAVEQAVKLMRSREQDAFDLSKEADAVRDEYGRTPFGQGCLLARRLVEVGVPFVEVDDAGSGADGGYDSHSGKHQQGVIRSNFPRVDKGMSALIKDLDKRGLLQDTLIIWAGEFGRTPRINAGGGRDHYAKAWTTFLAGGGVKGGQVVGKTDAKGGEVVERPVSEKDFFATVLTVLGIDPQQVVKVPDGRRHVTWAEAGAEVVREVLPG